MTSPGGSTPFKDGADRPVAHRTNGGRVAPRTVGELKFTIQDLLRTSKREWRTELAVTDRAGTSILLVIIVSRMGSYGQLVY